MLVSELPAWPDFPFSELLRSDERAHRNETIAAVVKGDSHVDFMVGDMNADTIKAALAHLRLNALKQHVSPAQFAALTNAHIEAMQ